MDKVNKFFKEPCTNPINVATSKHFKKEDQNENNELVVDVVDTDMVGVCEPSSMFPANKFKQHPDEIQLIDESKNAELEFIAKPEEAGGIV